MGSVLSPPITIPGMWFTRPAYDSYTPYYSYVPHGYGHSSRGDPLTRAAARDREAATRYRPAPPRWQDTTRSPYNSYLSDDDDDGSFVPYLYDPRTHSYTPHVDEDLRLRQSLEQQRQLQFAHQAELNRRREAKRAQELVERTYRSQEPEVSFVFLQLNHFRSPRPDLLSPLTFSPHPVRLLTFQSPSLHQTLHLLRHRLQNPLNSKDIRPRRPHQSPRLWKLPGRKSAPQ